jgi:hypothetical protein
LGGGGVGRAALPVPGAPGPVLLLEVGGVDFAANFSFLAFCKQSGQVTSLALAD